MVLQGNSRRLAASHGILRFQRSKSMSVGTAYHSEDEDDSAVALEALCRVPLKFGPRLWRELGHGPLHLALERGDLGQSLPRVLLHLKVFAGLHAEIQAQPVAHKDIQNPLSPVED